MLLSLKSNYIFMKFETTVKGAWKYATIICNLIYFPAYF